MESTANKKQRMRRRVRIEGYAIVSADGMIADRDRQMPQDLKIDADVRFFNQGLDSAAVVVHGRHSHEQSVTEVFGPERQGPFPGKLRRGTIMRVALLVREAVAAS